MSEKLNSVFSFPGTGMDTDSDLVTISPGDSRYRKNISVSDDGNYNVISTSMGNTLKTHTLPATGVNKVVGYVEDKENDAGIFFVYNSLGRHCIVRYNAALDAPYNFTNIIYDESALGFPSDKFIDAGIIGNEDDQVLVWVHNSAPRSINIAKAIAGGYTTYNAEVLSFYKYPLSTGIYTIMANYDVLSPRVPNKNLSNKIFQFAIRLKYDDKSYSTVSNHSVIPFPKENIPSGRISGDIGYDVINVTVIFSNEPSIIDSYQLLYRVIDVGAGVSGSWYIYEEYPYTAKGTVDIPFLNDRSIGIVSDEEMARPYDYVPDLANHVGVVDSNRAIFDVAKEGYDNVALNVTTTQSEYTVPSDEEGIYFSQTSSITYFGPASATFTIDLEPAGTPNNDYNILFDIDSNPYSLSSYGLSGAYIGAEIRTYFLTLFPTGLSITNNSTATVISLTFTNIAIGTSVLKVSALVLEKTLYYRTLKTGAKYKFGIEYGYNGKRGPVQTDDNCILPVNDFSDISSTYTNYVLKASFNIYHTPPIGATDFRIVSFGSDIDFFEEYVVCMDWAFPDDSGSEFTMYLDEPYTIIKRDDMLNRMRLAYGGGTETVGTDSVNYGIDYGFDYQVGDLVKFVGYFYQPVTWSDVAYDVAIIDIDEYPIEVVSSTEIKINSSAARLLSAYNQYYFLIQIIRKKDTFDSIAQEFSPSWPIVNGYHFGQNSSLPARIGVTTYFADTWKSKQVYVNEKNNDLYIEKIYAYAWMEKNRISLYYDSSPASQGRVNAVNPFSEAKGYNKIRWGGKFIDDAGVNFMSKFEYDNEKLLDDRNGAITKIQQIGDTLKVYQERKVSSLYLKTTSSDDPNGTSTFVFSDNVMSDPRQSAVDYGCTHFTSYARDVRTSYFFDLGNKAVLVDTPGGIMSITDGTNKMDTYFGEKAAEIVAYGKDLVQIHGEYDDYLNIYVISFIVPLFPAHAINDTVAYHVPSKRWITHFSLPSARKLEYYGRLTGNTLISFVGSQLYLHNSNQTRNNFWGEQFDSEIWIHANESPILNKIYDSIEINSVGQWHCPDNDSIEINKPSLMRSRIPAGRFKRQEGVYRSDFLRNALNALFIFVRDLLLNGKLLRGREMTIKLKNTDTTESQLETVIVKSTISK